MRRAFSNFGHYSFPTASIDETQVYGVGGPLTPLLFVPVQLDARLSEMDPRLGVRLGRLRGKLCFPSAMSSLTSYDAAVNLLVRPDYPASSDHHVILEFPLDSAKIVELEKQRAGKDLRLRLDLFLETEKLCALHEGKLPNNPVWGHVERIEQRLQDEIIFPQSSWIERVLPNIGVGKIHIIELPAVSIEATASLGQSFEALKQAQSHHRQGLYDDAVGKCRVALDQFFEYVENPAGKDKPRIPILKASWQTRLGEATYNWLNASLSAIKGPTNKPHHSPDKHFDQFESQMIQTIAATLIAYAARNGEEKALR